MIGDARGDQPPPPSHDALCSCLLLRQEEMCPKGEGVSPQRCVWSSAVNVRDKYVYASQPLQSRLLVVDIQAQKVVQVGGASPASAQTQPTSHPLNLHARSLCSATCEGGINQTHLKR